MMLLVAAALAWTVFGGERAELTPTVAEIERVLPGTSAQTSEGGFVASGSGGFAEVWATGDGAAADLAGADVARLIESNTPDRVLYLGDVYESGTAEEFAQNYATTFGRFAAITAPTPGNHEAPNLDAGYRPYWGEVYGEAPPRFYSFELGGWEILSLNSEVPYGPGSNQIRWIDEATRGEGDCRLAFWHRPRYSAGTNHGDDPGLDSLWDALAGRARLIVNGHDHNMQRLGRRRGIVPLIAGAGGKDRYPIDPDYRGLRFGNDRLDGALRLRLRPGHGSYAFVSVSGQILDSGSLRCEMAPGP